MAKHQRQDNKMKISRLSKLETSYKALHLTEEQLPIETAVGSRTSRSGNVIDGTIAAGPKN